MSYYNHALLSPLYLAYSTCTQTQSTTIMKCRYTSFFLSKNIQFDSILHSKSAKKNAFHLVLERALLVCLQALLQLITSPSFHLFLSPPLL
uniref:Uncharacterized protein n=1 Tax=Anguilla anguilla TaxID=7936 RepID=A0A0E9X590_ANGAN